MTDAKPLENPRVKRDLARIGRRLEADRADEFRTTEEVAAYHKVSAKTLVDWRYKGTGPKTVKVGRHIRYRMSDLRLWLAENTVTPKARG